MYCNMLLHAHYILVRQDANHIADGFTATCVFDQQQSHCAEPDVISRSRAV